MERERESVGSVGASQGGACAEERVKVTLGKEKRTKSLHILEGPLDRPLPIMIDGALQDALERHADLRGMLERYPTQAAPLVQTLADLTHASLWHHLSVIDTSADDREEHTPDGLGRALVVGLRPEAKGLEAIWCCSISDMLSSAM